MCFVEGGVVYRVNLKVSELWGDDGGYVVLDCCVDVFVKDCCGVGYEVCVDEFDVLIGEFGFGEKLVVV